VYETPEFRALRREYVASALQRVGYLRSEAGSLGRAIDLVRLRQEVHKLRGSGGFYGFHELSAVAAAAEAYLVQICDGEATLEKERLGALIDAVAEAAQAASREVGRQR
jgi:chemotaxis protein histidine kinase CheA